MNIYVGTLSREVTEEDLGQAFEVFGQVSSIAIIKDRSTGISKGFGCVEMPAQPEAQAAIDSLNGTELKGSALKVSEARRPFDKVEHALVASSEILLEPVEDLGNV